MIPISHLCLYSFLQTLSSLQSFSRRRHFLYRRYPYTSSHYLDIWGIHSSIGRYARIPKKSPSTTRRSTRSHLFVTSDQFRAVFGRNCRLSLRKCKFPIRSFETSFSQTSDFRDNFIYTIRNPPDVGHFYVDIFAKRSFRRKFLRRRSLPVVTHRDIRPRRLD